MVHQLLLRLQSQINGGSILLQKVIECVYLTFLTFLTTTAIAMLLVKWTWIDMIINSGGIILSSVVFVVFYYLINSYFQINHYSFWLNKIVGYTIIISSLFIIAATNGFQIQRLMVTPAIVIRNGFFLKGVTTSQVNTTLLIIMMLGIVSCFILNNKNSFKRAVCHKKIELTKRQKKSFKVILSLGYLCMVIYTIQPTIRYLINGIFQ